MNLHKKNHTFCSNSVDGSQELEYYINTFPQEEYIVCEVPKQGKFYVEPRRKDHVKDILKTGQAWEPHILEKIEQYVKPGTIVLDIGAHIGTFTIPLAKAVGESGTVYAFEPQRKIFRELIKNCALNGFQNVICQRLAIGDQHQVIEMDKETYPGSEGSTGIGYGGDAAEMRTIDSFGFKNVSFVKIDVERSENQVLDGMVLTIQNNKPIIIIELQGGYCWETAPTHIRQKMQDSIDKLTTLGYVVTRLYLHDFLAMPAGIH